jgi:hypothetical protein
MNGPSDQLYPATLLTFEMESNILNAALLLPVAMIPLLRGSTDVILLLSFGLYKSWGRFQEFIDIYIDVPLVIDVAKTFAALFALLQIIRYFSGLQGTPHSLDGFPSKVMFFPGKTSHTRLFPKKYTFSYSYLLVGIPVGWKGSVGGMLAVHYEKKLAPWYLRWLSLSAGNT